MAGYDGWNRVILKTRGVPSSVWYEPQWFTTACSHQRGMKRGVYSLRVATGRGSLEAPLWIDRLRRRSLPIKRDGPIVEAIPTPMTDLLATAWVSPPGTTDLLATAVRGVCVRVFGLGPVPLGDGLNWGSVSRRRFSLPSLGDGSRPP